MVMMAVQLFALCWKGVGHDSQVVVVMWFLQRIKRKYKPYPQEFGLKMMIIYNLFSP